MALASQRIEYVLIEWFGPDWLVDMMEEWKLKERGSIPGPVELFIMMYVCGKYIIPMHSCTTSKQSPIEIPLIEIYLIESELTQSNKSTATSIQRSSRP